MATIRSYTTIEQSKVLAKILPIESADMQWFLEEDYGIVQIKEELQDWGGDCTIPCWSLTSLLGVLPSATLDSSDDHHYRLHCMERYTGWYDNPVDACVDMIIKLNELNLL